jgi:uncharacterized protein
MFRLILLAAIIYILFKWLWRSTPPAAKPRTFEPPQDQKVEEMLQDPVCGTWVPVGQAVILDRDKETLYFCSAECREKFLQAPPPSNP